MHFRPKWYKRTTAVNYRSMNTVAFTDNLHSMTGGQYIVNSGPISKIGTLFTIIGTVHRRRVHLEVLC